MSPDASSPLPEVAYAVDGPPPHGEAVEVAPGVLWVQMPLPFRLNHVNLYLIEDDDGWVVVDTGFHDDETVALWDRVLANGLGGKGISGVIVTHFHPDHLGQGQRLAEIAGRLPRMTRTEWLMAKTLAGWPGETYARVQGRFFQSHGLDGEMLDALQKRGNAYAVRVGPVPDRYERIEDGQVLGIGGREWRVIVGQGHAPEQATLYCAALGLLISADQVLPKITPNVSQPWTEPNADPLAAFLASLDRYEPLPADTLVLPSHRLPFRGLHARLEQLRHHHDERLHRVLAVCADGPRSAAELLPVLFEIEMDLHHVVFAMGEAIAHLEHLAQSGRLARTEDAGVVRYESVS